MSRRAKFRALAILFAAAPDVAGAQAISPVVVQYEGRARGRIQLANGSLYPMNVVLEPVGFAIDSAGELSFFPLDSAVRLELSTTSFRLSPKETYPVFYEASAPARPAWFTIYATVTPAVRSEGLQIARQLPHTVYLLGKQRLSRDSVALQAAANSREVTATVENLSAALGRVRQVELRSRSGQTTSAGFPLLPRHRRVLRLDWDRPEPVETIVLIFEKFELSRPLGPRREDG